MSDGPDSKNLVLGLISTNRQKPSVREKQIASPPRQTEDVHQASTNKPPIGRHQLRDMVAKGESRDPIAGKRFRDTEKVTTGIHIRADVHKTLKILAAIERRKFNAYIEEAIDDYLEKIADRIPDIS
ncbi:hypothetical protein U8C32_25905 (plasmid) [Sinorhizobium medicae]|uniref:hypothetical protein n=1 Tax=Sinorhizobium medicae TaxID=110321 RepID=UPI002AF6AF9F|nr:hypothetical protein [Sinorhizobium medicae]WQO48377.1 hypothetical protein U8C42_26135 [Sinorhizobium medicae]WQO68791.1 hypothetical protein U8C40_27615 [Sinorhizobium medicae]WQO75830.1 hypothetical protein U8C31_27030 [Sinorhizobium medicae]WQO94989.1 hypothetical protein U8C32_25905 [Sinorhizobium medicae]